MNLAASYYNTNPSIAPEIKYGDEEVTLIHKNTVVSASGAPMEGTSKTKLEQYLQSCASYDISALSIKCNGLHANVCPFSGGGGLTLAHEKACHQEFLGPPKC